MGSVDGAELAHAGLDVFVDRPFRDVENLSDLPGRFTFGHPSENFVLPGRQLVPYCLTPTQEQPPI